MEPSADDAKQPNRAPRWIGPALALSFALNVAALVTPFLETESLLGRPKLYSLPRSVELMWSARLYALALLVVAFSIVFPFAKLAVLWLAWRAPAPSERLMRQLAFVERFGKWSMLDVFIVCLLLSLTGDQYFIAGRPLEGLPCFLAAIVLSMVCGEVLASHFRLPHSPPQARAKLGWVLLAALAHIAAAFTPFLQVDSFWLSSNRVSIASMARSLFALDWAAWAPALSIAVFVALAPLAGLLTQYRGQHEWSARWQRWSMLDVFLLALVVYLVEGKSFVPTAIGSGAYWLAVAMGFSLLTRRVARAAAG